jgi:LacI family transcriptional regulator
MGKRDKARPPVYRDSRRRKEATPAGHLSLAALAAASSVSKSTASRVLSGNSMVAEATRAHSMAEAARLGFRPNPYLKVLMTSLRARGPLPFRAALAWLDCAPCDEG